MATAESVKAKIQGLIDTANEATGNGDTDLTAAVGALVAGFGQGGGGDNPLDYATTIEFLCYQSYASADTLTVRFGSKAKNVRNTALSYVFTASNAIKNATIIYEGTLESAVTVTQICRGSKVESIDLSQISPLTISNMDRAFREAFALKSILGELDMSSCTNFNGAFYGTRALETVRFKAGTINLSIDFALCSELTDASIQSIIDGLADLTGGTAQTLTLHADIGAKLTDAQTTAASAKNWTISY